MNETKYLNIKPDIIVGLPSYNEKDSISKVLKIIDKGLQNFYNPQKCLIINLDSDSEDNTRSVFLDTKTICAKKTYNTGKNPRGKGKNLFKLFNLCLKLNAKYVATIDSDIITINENWPKFLLQPLIERKFDCVTPIYTRNRFEGSTTNHLAYPLIYAIFGTEIRQPIGGEFGLSQKLCKYLLKQPVINTTLQYGIDIFITCHAIGGGFKITESFLGKKFHKSSFPKIFPTFKHTLSSAIQTTKIYQDKKYKAKPILMKTKRRVNIDPLSKYPHKKEVPILLKQMKSEFIKNEKEYQKYLGGSFEAIRKIIKSGKTTMSSEPWTEALALFLKHCYKKKLNQELISHISDLVTPIFIWRVTSFWRVIEKETPEKIEMMIKKQAKLLRKKMSI